jgi:crotonobetainyl-CoA:carnitine CoA-transferase CaiB-like acyl-CoA transferase
LGEARFAVRLPPPALSEHTDAILAELGYEALDIERMHAAGAAVASRHMLDIESPGGPAR